MEEQFRVVKVIHNGNSMSEQVELECGYLLYDNYNNRPLLQLRFANNCRQPIQSMTVRAQAFDAFGNLMEAVDYTYTKCESPDFLFGSDEGIYMSTADAAEYKVQITGIQYAAGQLNNPMPNMANPGAAPGKAAKVIIALIGIVVSVLAIASAFVPVLSNSGGSLSFIEYIQATKDLYKSCSDMDIINALTEVMQMTIYSAAQIAIIVIALVFGVIHITKLIVYGDSAKMLYLEGVLLTIFAVIQFVFGNVLMIEIFMVHTYSIAVWLTFAAAVTAMITGALVLNMRKHSGRLTSSYIMYMLAGVVSFAMLACSVLPIYSSNGIKLGPTGMIYIAMGAVKANADETSSIIQLAIMIFIGVITYVLMFGILQNCLSVWKNVKKSDKVRGIVVGRTSACIVLAILIHVLFIVLQNVDKSADDKINLIPSAFVFVIVGLNIVFAVLCVVGNILRTKNE